MPKKGEQLRSAGYFQEYLDLGPKRTVPMLAHIHFDRQNAERPTYSTWLTKLKQLSIKYHWLEKAKNYDAQVAEERRKKREEAKDAMDEEHALLGRTHALRITKYINDQIESKKMNSQAGVALFKIATDLERVARGAATENKTVTVDDKKKENVLEFDLSKLTTEQLEQLEKIAEEMEGRPKEEIDEVE